MLKHVPSSVSENPSKTTKEVQTSFAKHKKLHSSKHLYTMTKTKQFVCFASTAVGHIISSSLVLEASISTVELYAIMETIFSIHHLLGLLKCHIGSYH